MRIFGRSVPAGIILLLAVSTIAQDKPDSWLLFANGDRGSITAHTTRQDLVRAYGAQNVVDKGISSGEEGIVEGTVLFPNDPERSIEIFWNDFEKKAEPSSLTIRGDKSRWKTVHDISLGTSLKDLERLNGRPFKVTGFDYDLAATVSSWESGSLEKELAGGQGHVYLRLTCSHTGSAPITNAEHQQLVGDREFSSDHPVLQKINPCVGEMIWTFPQKTEN